MRQRQAAVSGRRRLAVAGVLALALCTALAMTLGSTAEAKKGKKHKAAKVFQQSLTVNAAVPNLQPGPSVPSTPIRSTITVGKKFKGQLVGDVDVTGIQTTGSGSGAADDLRMKLTAPNGRTVYLIGSGIGDVSIGPLTIDAESPVSICDAPTVASCADPAQSLVQPFAGTANTLGLGATGTGGVRAFNGVGMKGSWTFTIWDQSGAGTTNVFNGWGLKIRAAKPIA
jgi:hypothetical protein